MKKYIKQSNMMSKRDNQLNTSIQQICLLNLQENFRGKKLYKRWANKWTKITTTYFVDLIPQSALTSIVLKSERHINLSHIFLLRFPYLKQKFINFLATNLKPKQYQVFLSSNLNRHPCTCKASFNLVS